METEWLKKWCELDTAKPNAEEYRSLMQYSGLPSIDISPSYASMPQERVRDLKQSLTSGSKAFVLLRNPLDRAMSEVKLHTYLHGHFRGQASDGMIADFVRAPHRRNARDYDRICHIWGEEFGKDFSVFYYEDMLKNAAAFLREISDFLGITNLPDSFFERYELKKYVATDRNQLVGSIYPSLNWSQQRYVAQALFPEVEGFCKLDEKRVENWLEDISMRFSHGARNVPIPEEQDCTYQRLLRLTESLGDNCEFGFVQRYHGYEPSSLFRWTITPIDKLANYLENPAPVFEKINLRCNPNSELVHDEGTGFSFHSDLIAQTKSGCALIENPKFDEIYQREREKIKHLELKFQHFARSRPGIFFVKANSALDGRNVSRLRDALILKNPENKLVHVSQDVDVTLDLLSEGLYIGTIPKFADYHTANKIDLNAWKKLLRLLAERVEIRVMTEKMFV